MLRTGGAVALLPLIICPSIAESCTCAPVNPPCAAYWGAAVIFRGRVDGIERAPAGSPDPMASIAVTFSVLESLRGLPSPGAVRIKTPGAASACGYRFRVGREYVVYASRAADGALTTTTCSRTGPVERSSADLAYARSIAKGADRLGRVGGRVVLRYRDLARGRDREQPARDLLLVLGYGSGVVEARTDRAGAFSVSGLDAGVYDLLLKYPADMRFSLNPERIELADVRGCADVKIVVNPDGRVAGRILDAHRRPVAGVTVDLVPFTSVNTASSRSTERLRTTSRRDGRYVFTGVPPGTFAVGINTRDEIDGIARVLHPGVTEVSAGTAVAVGAGARVDAGDLVLPSSIEVVQIVGFVFDAHGVPVEGARVYLRGPNERDFIIGEPVTSDFMGRFTIAAAAEGSYQLFAERPRPGDSRGRIDASHPLSFAASRSDAPLILRLHRQ